MIFQSTACAYLWFPAGKMGAGLARQTRPAASEEEWARVDSLFREVSAELQLVVYLVLTAEPAERAAEELFVFLEPCAELVMAVTAETGEVSIHADWWWWRVFRAELDELQELVGSNARAGRTIDALVEGLRRLRALFGGAWQVKNSFDRSGNERAVITQGDRRWEVTRG